MALYLHRFLESSIAPAFARRVLLNSAYSQIFVGLSNLGELLGALTVFVFSDAITTPVRIASRHLRDRSLTISVSQLPWLRLDALMLNLVWAYIPLARQAVPNTQSWAFRVGALNIPISFGWAAGDVSLAGQFLTVPLLLLNADSRSAAYVQASLSNMNFVGHENVSALGAVMALLYSTYIILNAMISTLLGRVIDQDFTTNRNIYKSLEQIAGSVFFAFASNFLRS